ncbi:hypothetical protein DPMN_158985 [Dreissena polymorpha]|uniref:Uncharacterized protein n=1 Tax=Dreissena polymorpha TaxID=45954 RepID=A0A9D4INR2_DREPO|nr:hypothetical protein DPMN_158985 [Dreissena polymorpha]
MKPASGTKMAKDYVMVFELVLQFVSVALGFGFIVMYPELISVFDAKRSEVALIQGLYVGFTT